MPAHDGWMSFCLSAALLFQPHRALPRFRTRPGPIHRGIALKAEPPGLPFQDPQLPDGLRLKSKEPRPTLPPGLPPGLRF